MFIIAASLAALFFYALFMHYLLPDLSVFMTVRSGALSAAILTVAHVWIEERFFGNQRDINWKVFKGSRARDRYDFPVTDAHNRYLHQGFIAWFLLACCAGAFWTQNPYWLVPVTAVFIADGLIQHPAFIIQAGGYVAGLWTGFLYGAWAILWWKWSLIPDDILFRTLFTLGFVLIFGNLGFLALRASTGK